MPSVFIGVSGIRISGIAITHVFLHSALLTWLICILW
jgi:hypothetical protein